MPMKHPLTKSRHSFRFLYLLDLLDLHDSLMSGGWKSSLQVDASTVEVSTECSVLQ